MKYFAALMCILYVMLGSVMIWSGSPLFASKYSVPIGSLMIVYGLFRGYRLYQRYFIKS